MTTTTYRVNGMTCEHCVRAVTDELTQVDGITAVTIDLQVGDTSTVTVHSDTTPDADAVAEAIDEAGYTLA